MKVYKITTAESTNYRGQKFQAGELCPEHDNPNFHYRVYHTPELATLFHPFYDAWENPVLWEGEGFGYGGVDDGIMCAVKQVKLVQQIPFVPYSVQDHIRFGIYCALLMIEDPLFVKWATNWIHGVEQDTKKIADEYEVGQEFGSAAHAVFESVLQPAEARYYAACGAWRAYCDSDCRLDLMKIAEMVKPSS
jgi:hypothetical protein